MKEMNLGRILIETAINGELLRKNWRPILAFQKARFLNGRQTLSLPDISLLLQLASYFDITIDELIGYEPQMEKRRLRNSISAFPRTFRVAFDDVLAGMPETAKKYYSCYPLLFQLGTLLINHAAQVSNSSR